MVAGLAGHIPTGGQVLNDGMPCCCHGARGLTCDLDFWQSFAAWSRTFFGLGLRASGDEVFVDLGFRVYGPSP